MIQTFKWNCESSEISLFSTFQIGEIILPETVKETNMLENILKKKCMLIDNVVVKIK